ncbi:MAG: hypothetical protein PUI46_02975 [Lachnospiraceae bacterium]|nr:hypothetical protein [Lachnospiraceae bacterium]
MFKKRWGKKMLALGLATALTLSNLMPISGGSTLAYAASAYEKVNLLKNPTFEEETPFSPANSTSQAGNWYYWKETKRTKEDAHEGTHCAKLAKTNAALEQDIPDLQVGMTYVYSAWARLSEESDTAKHYIGVKNHGGSEIRVEIESTDWQLYTLEFTCTSDTGNARVYAWVEEDGGVESYVDDASVKVKSDIQSASIQNGRLEVTFADDYTGVLSADSFTATCTTSADAANVQNLTLTEVGVNNKVLTMTFPQVKALPVEQTVTVNLTHTGSNQTITLNYEVEASKEAATARIASVTASNGRVSVLLDANPATAPVAAEFTWEYMVGTGEAQPLTVENFAYDSDTKTITANFNEIGGIPEGEQKITVRATYHNQTQAGTFVIPASTSRTYYVSAAGSDTNDGLTENTPFKTIGKLNTITFLPGDKILFKNGDTFTGCFKPKGSGTAQSPITIGCYGDKAKGRPVLQPGEDFTVPRLMSANAIVNNPTVNYVIWFYNVEYWEVSNLELKDPKHDVTFENPGEVYRSGITIQAEDIGTLEHLYVDNMIIHGFHGPRTNIGKSSGGITMNVITNGERNRALSTPTQINDIRITNCEIYNVGRSGINFLTPWAFRNEEKWGPFNYGTKGYDYFPYENFYMGNNYIHDVDGDGTIIDNCSGAVAEYNLVTRCVLRCNNAAVGMFNWNSDDTYFQFNEVFDIRYGGNDSNHLNDSQGIEIDALNDGTWVQYNYVHDNTGGFMMLCNVSDNYRSFDGIIRYNISQNDYAHPRQGMFDIYSANYGTKVYNNTFYFTERAVSQKGYGTHVKPGELFLFSAVGARDTMKFYNNIFYYKGDTPIAANSFGDDAIDWQSNIFYGFTNLPKNDNPKAPNLNTDPRLVNPGAGASGTYTPGKEQLGRQVDLSCYYLQSDSPAINAGVAVEDNGGRDYFGNPITGNPDIGAHEYQQ